MISRQLLFAGVLATAALLIMGCTAAPLPNAQLPFSFNGVGTRVQAKPLTDQLKAMLTRNQPSELRASFTQFKAAVGTAYATAAEEAKRYTLYLNRLSEIVAANSDPARTYVSGVNQFADRTPEELQMLLMSTPPTDMMGPRAGGRRLVATEGKVMGTPENVVKRKLQAAGVDWRAMGGVTPVRNQGQCGSCWAFAATAAIESAYLIAGYATDVDLSEQQMVSCSGGGSCNGGSSKKAMRYVVTNNQVTESTFPYSASDLTCSSAIKGNPGVSLSASVREVAYNSVTALQEAVARQPIVFYFNVEDNFFTVADGIYNGPCDDQTINHAMLVVGYGWDANNNGYWIVKNSWGTWWNSKGYIKIAMLGDGNGMCGMYAYGLYYPDLSPADKGFDSRLNGNGGGGGGGGGSTTCSVGFYATGGSCVRCAGNGALSPSGATSQDQCFCSRGRYYRMDVGCSPCDRTSTTGSSADGKTCQCADGYSDWSADTGACTANSCPNGSYFSAADGACMDCAGTGASSYSGGTDQSACYCTSGTDYYVPDQGCTSCDPDTTSGSADGLTCDCAEGFEAWDPASGACSPTNNGGTCLSGQYDSGSGCTDCAGDGTALTDSGATSEAECYCEAGGPNFYREQEGCVPCDEASTTGTSDDGTSCSCAVNYKDWDPATGACTLECTSGYYLQDVGNGPECVACAGIGNALTPPGATSESECTCPVTNLIQAYFYKAGAGCAKCGTGTTGKSLDGKTCACLTGYRNFNPVTGICSRGSTSCTQRAQLCGAGKPPCCTGTTCRRSGAQQKCL